MRHGHIGDAFFDLDASQFLLGELQRERHAITEKTQTLMKTTPATAKIVNSSSSGGDIEVDEEEKPSGHAVGPAWTRQLLQTSAADDDKSENGSFCVELGCEVLSINSNSTCSPSLEVTLSDGRKIPTDVVISVIGVDPAVNWIPKEVECSSEDGGLVVDKNMETSVKGIYAAGDACSMQWALETSTHWFQMRLWSQARSQGVYAAHCMAGVADQMGTDMAFEVFTHVTRFLGKKVSGMSIIFNIFLKGGGGMLRRKRERVAFFLNYFICYNTESAVEGCNQTEQR